MTFPGFTSVMNSSYPEGTQRWRGASLPDYAPQTMVHWLIKLYFVFLPVACISYPYGYFRITISMAIGYILSLVAILSALRRPQATTILFGLLVSYMTITSSLRWSVAEWFPPICAFTLANALVLLGPQLRTQRTANNMIFLATLTAIIADAAQIVLTLNAMDYSSLIPGKYLANAGFSDVRFEFTRLRGLFIEPAHQGVFGSAVVYCAARLGAMNTNKISRKNSLAFYGGVFLVASSVSLSGAFLLLAALLLAGLDARRVRRTAIALMLLGLVIVGSNPSYFYDYIYSRSLNAASQFNPTEVSKQSLRNDGARANALAVATKYLLENDAYSALFGEGHGNHENWCYRNLYGTPLQYGQIPNAVVNIILGNGIFGSCLALGLLLSYYGFPSAGLPAIRSAAFMLSVGFAYGSLTTAIYAAVCLAVYVSTTSPARIPCAPSSAGIDFKAREYSMSLKGA